MLYPLWCVEMLLEIGLLVLLMRRASSPVCILWLAFDVVSQAVEWVVALAGWGRGYRLTHRTAEIVNILLLCWVVALDLRRLKYPQLRLVVTTAIAVPAHLVFAGVPRWSIVAGIVWQTIALSHAVLGGVLLPEGGPLCAWLLGTSALYYAAPYTAIGVPLMVWQIGCFAAWIWKVARTTRQ